MRSDRTIGPLASCLLAVTLAACGGGGGSGGGSSGSAPAPSPAPAPAPAPAPPPTGVFDDSEFRASAWLVADNALPAFEAGGTGRGATIAIVDSGIDGLDAEFAGRIVPGTNGAGNVGSHGTAVARIAAAARNGSGVMGVAFEATILSYNAERCNPDCFILIDEIALAVDDAVRRGARVINLSVVGPSSREPLLSALQRATQAGVVVVIAAGNDGGPDPNGFALQNAQGVNSRLVVIVGAHGPGRQPTGATSRAGVGAQWYLSAYSDGATSSSTPVVSGTVALIAGSFPTLTGTQIVDVLFASAEDADAPGRDAVFGNGILDIGRAYAQARVLAGGP